MQISMAESRTKTSVRALHFFYIEEKEFIFKGELFKLQEVSFYEVTVYMYTVEEIKEKIGSGQWTRADVDTIIADLKKLPQSLLPMWGRFIIPAMVSLHTAFVTVCILC